MARLSRLVGRGRALEILLVADDLDGPYVDRVTLPADHELPPALADFVELFGRPRRQDQYARLEALGFNTDSDLERRLGHRVVESTPDA